MAVCAGALSRIARVGRSVAVVQPSGRSHPPARRAGLKAKKCKMAENNRNPWTDQLVQELVASGATLSEIAEMLARAESNAKERREPWPSASPGLSVNKITWAQVGRAAEPGRYMFTFGWLTITADDLAIWKEYPNAAFTLYSTAVAMTTQSGGASGEKAGEEFRLGAFEPRSDSNYSESEK
jgi:hypothetical protein